MLTLSIIVPSYAQGRYIEKTILSILDQRYPQLELIVIDGGSGDETKSVLQKFNDRIAFWVSEKDKGQSHAINKGFARATGDIVAWINSDDLYQIDTFQKVIKSFEDSSVIWVTGDCEVINETGAIINYYTTEIPTRYDRWINLMVRGYSTALLQPSTFWRREVLQRVGALNENFHYSFDHEFFLRIFKEFGPPKVLSTALSKFRLHGSSKTVNNDVKFKKENMKIGMECARRLPFTKFIYFILVYIRQRYFSG